MSFLSRLSSQELLYFGEPFLCKEEEHEYTVQFNQDIGFKDFENGVRAIYDQQRNYRWGMVYFHFRKPIKMLHRGKSKAFKVYSCQTLFVSIKGSLCYKPVGNISTGWHIDELAWKEVEKIVLRNPAHEEEQQKKDEKFEKAWKKACKARFDEQTWTDLKPEQLLRKPFPVFFDMKKVWFDFDLDEIKEHFQKKDNFTMHYHADRRHYKVVGRLDEQGIYRVWFASRNPKNDGTLKEYILLNPNLAVLTFVA